MTLAVPFEDFFTKSRAEVPKPKSLPRGNWILVLRGTFKRPPREDGKSGQVSFLFEPVEPMDDVDPGELLDLGDNYSFKDNKPTAEFWLGSWSDVDRVWEHLALYGLDVDAYDDLDVALKDAHNKRIIAYVSPVTYVHAVKGPQTKDVASGFKPAQ